MHACVYIHTHASGVFTVCIYTCMYVCMYAHRHTCTCTTFSCCTYECMHTHMMLHSVLAGARPDQPEECPSAVWQVMEECWKQSAGDRPTWASLKMRIQDAYGAEMAAQAARERDEQSLCVVCLEKLADFALLPCGHKCVCQDDAAVMCNQGMCPICRTPVHASIRIF